ncbi:hypothetical protein SLS55_003185 [Diplodia seriata]|uniref:Uncharacterized protein n=1 Tax=Diplodia seriata TaxID=420778 RepID=A0ABR3CMB8_9PEZI
MLIKKSCPPERRKATIAVSASASSPTLSISSNPPQDFKIHISLRIAQTTRPGQAITILGNETIFEYASARGDILRQRRGGLIATATKDEPPERRRRINLGSIILHHARMDPPPSPDLKERPWARLLTIPAEGSVEITHDLPLARMFEYERKLKPEDLVGEEWQFRFVDAFVGTTWWCWGDLDGDLREKHLSTWHEATFWEPKPEVDDTWVLGLDPSELTFEVDQTGSEFRFVE